MSSPIWSEGINELVPNWRPLGVCTDAEPRLKMALEDCGIIVVNGLIAVKAVGDTVGVALREEELAGGITELDTWYEIDYGLSGWHRRDAIKDAFCAGEVGINFSTPTRWLKLRPVQVDQVCSGQDLTEVVRATVDRLIPGKTDINGMSKDDYFEQYESRY